jgi:hypothetical protein
MINSTRTLPGSSRAPLPHAPATSSRLPAGWVNTEKYGEVYVSPGGIAWVVQRQGNKLESVSVKITKDDIIGKNATEKRKDAIQKAARRTMSKVLRTTPPILTTGGAGKGNQRVVGMDK